MQTPPNLSFIAHEHGVERLALFCAGCVWAGLCLCVGAGGESSVSQAFTGAASLMRLGHAYSAGTFRRQIVILELQCEIKN